MFYSETMAPELGQFSAQPAGAWIAVEGLAEVVGEGVGGGDGVLAGLDLDGAVAAGGPDELPDGPAGLVLDPAADGQGGEHDGQVGFDRVALVRGRSGRACRSLLDIRNDFSIWNSWW